MVGSQRLAEAAFLIWWNRKKQIEMNGLILRIWGTAVLCPYMNAVGLEVEAEEDLAGAAAAEVGTASG